MPESKPTEADNAPVSLPVTAELDLHTFMPQEIPGLVREYLRLCRERGILEVRVIHGKGTGQLLRTVQAVLGRMSEEVMGFQLAAPAYGGEGATWVRLRPIGEGEARKPGPSDDAS